MTRRYEIVYIFDSAKEEPQIEEHLERFHALLKSKENPDPIRNVNHWGKRSLAYAIAGNEIGYYVVVQFSADPTLLPEFERLVKLEPAVIRFQIVLNEGELPVPAPAPEAAGGDKESKGSGPKGDETKVPVPAPAPEAAGGDKESKGSGSKGDETEAPVPASVPEAGGGDEESTGSSKSDEETTE